MKLTRFNKRVSIGKRLSLLMPFCRDHQTFMDHNFDRAGFSKFVCPQCQSENLTQRSAGDEQFYTCDDCGKSGA